MNCRKTRKTGLILGLATLMAGTSAMAQPGGFGPHDMDPGKRLEMRVGFLQDRLDLDDDQLNSIRDILERAQEEAVAWRDDNPDASRGDRRAFGKEHRARTDAAILEILTEEQKEIFSEVVESHTARARGMHERRHMRAHRREHARRDADGMMHAFHRLNLSEEQKEAIHEILTEEQRSKLDRMLSHGRHGDHAGGPGMLLNRLDLTDDQKEQLKAFRESHRAAAKAWHDANPTATRKERRAFREAHREGMKATIGSILTDEQKSQLEELRKDRPWGGPKEAWDN